MPYLSSYPTVRAARLAACPTCGDTRRGHLLGRPLHCLNDVHVAGAPAVVARERPADLLFRRVRVLLEKRGCGDHHARGAVAALQPVLLVEPLLNRRELRRRAQALDGDDLVAVGLDAEDG